MPDRLWSGKQLAAIGKQARDRYIQQCCGGLNFEYFHVSTLLGTKPSDWKKELN